MNAHHFHNVGQYLSEFLRALQLQSAKNGRNVFSVQVLSEGLDEGDAALLR